MYVCSSSAYLCTRWIFTTYTYILALLLVFGGLYTTFKMLQNRIFSKQTWVKKFGFLILFSVLLNKLIYLVWGFWVGLKFDMSSLKLFEVCYDVWIKISKEEIMFHKIMKIFVYLTVFFSHFLSNMCACLRWVTRCPGC